jgi:hypothetical protein
MHVKDIASCCAQELRERQRRRALVQADFDQLREAGFLLVAVPVDQAGIWESVERRHNPSNLNYLTGCEF